MVVFFRTKKDGCVTSFFSVENKESLILFRTANRKRLKSRYKFLLDDQEYEYIIQVNAIEEEFDSNTK